MALDWGTASSIAGLIAKARHSLAVTFLLGGDLDMLLTNYSALVTDRRVLWHCNILINV